MVTLVAIGPLTATVIPLAGAVVPWVIRPLMLNTCTAVKLTVLVSGGTKTELVGG